MSRITPQLQAAARSAYRNLYRASTSTFAGDNEVLLAFRRKMRADALQRKGQTDPKTYEESVKLGNEVATILRRNFVQARNIASDTGGRWKIRITEHTELGNNDSIKNPPPMPIRGKGRRVNCQPDPEPSLEPTVPPPSPNRKLNYSQLKRAHANRVIPDLKESDLEESFVRGKVPTRDGPGGQSINKTNNNVQLLHKPTGIQVKCQETRSLQQNRKTARKILLEKASYRPWQLDRLYNPGLSKGDLKRARERERDRRRRKKARKVAASEDESTE
ncbi:hypothetical protein BDM02DRAFT_3140328 [Thelephora ganbajun]|uniref:Uncharacterized protein n=1 Tax=Thelephora ganbajun TaxID=370292 RepID=A0ACB6ZND2_THEGA|nr:hypothetical protein BDM02DRAFT_3140328 [Thelephora ganbajun]